MMESTSHTWWEAQNTGWSGGISWFNSGGKEQRFHTKEDAMEFNKRVMESFTDSETKWRVVKKTVIEEAYLMDKPHHEISMVSPYLRIVNNEYIVFRENEELMNFGNHFYSETDAYNYIQRLKLEEKDE